MRLLTLILLGVSLVVGAAADPLRVKTVKMKEYSVNVPVARDWDVSRDKRTQRVVMEKMDRRTGTNASIHVISQDTGNDYFTAHCVQWLGDDIRRREYANMIALGVDTGLYQLANVERFETDIGDKHGYVLRYDQVVQDVVAHGYLFVYFPPGFDKRGTYYKFLFSYAPKPEVLDTSLFEHVIASFELR